MLLEFITGYVIYMVWYVGMVFVPIGLLAWFAIRAVGKIKKKRVRIVCYVLLFFLAVFIWVSMEDNGWRLCYRGHC